MDEIEQTIAAGPFGPSWESLRGYKVPAWYEDGKFGIFIHWGLYAVPAFGNEWYARNMYQQGSREFAHHVATYGPQSEAGYKDFIPGLTAAQYDPAAWARLFKESGARFVVPVAEHHDGFAMYDCSFSDWTAARMGPRRDLVGELAGAVRAEGLVFGVSYHRAENWFFFDGGRHFPSDVQDDRFRGLYGRAQPAPADFQDMHEPPGPDAAFLDTWLRRVCELVDRYQPQLVWFDWWIGHDAFKAALQKFAAYYYNRAAAWGPDWNHSGAAINYKFQAFADGTAVFDIERGQVASIYPRFWQNDTSVARNSWGYTENQDYKTVDSLVDDLVDVVSKNGALLLNVGPRADGSIPEEEARMLREIGAWLAVNGEAIYGSRPWKVYGEGPTEVVEGSFSDTKRAAFTGQDIRFTTVGNTLYATALAWPGERLTIRSLAASAGLWDGPVAEVTLLGHPEPLAWAIDEQGMTIALPEGQVGEHAFTFKISS